MPPPKSAKSRVYVVKKTSDAYSPNVDLDEQGLPSLTHPIKRDEAIIVPEHMAGDSRSSRRVRATARAKKPKLGFFARISARIEFVLLLT